VTGPRVISPIFDQDEKSFTDQVLELAGLCGWRRAHFRAAQTVAGWRTPVQADGAGFPDLVLLRGPQIIVAELKARRGKLSPEQLDWLEAWRQAHVKAYVWRPGDWDDIVRVLR
jgi:hypothetical protein